MHPSYTPAGGKPTYEELFGRPMKPYGLRWYKLASWLIDDRYDDLNPWEREFLASVRAYERTPTEKQRKVFERIAARFGWKPARDEWTQ